MIRILHLSPSLLVVFRRILIYKMWPGMRRTIFMFVICLDCLFRGGSPQLSPVALAIILRWTSRTTRHGKSNDTDLDVPLETWGRRRASVTERKPSPTAGLFFLLTLIRREQRL